MPRATVAAVRKQLEAGRPDPIYLIQGGDEVEKSALAAAFAELVDEDVRAFNVEKFHGGDMATVDKLVEGIGRIVAAARTVPMMSPRRVILVVQAEGLLAPRRESETVARALDQLEQLFNRPEPQTTLVLVAGDVDKRSRLYKLLAKVATLVEVGTLEHPADAERWLKMHVAKAGREIDPAAARLIAVQAGTDVKRLRSDVDRLLMYTLGQKRITLDDVRDVTGPAALQDQWAMTNAIERGETADALRHLALMFDAGGIPEMILGQLGWVVRSKFPALAPGALRDAVDALFRTDLDLKRSAGDARVLLERLVVELCAVRRSLNSSRTLGR
jgi:DNA polymerase III delta subunit